MIPITEPWCPRESTRFPRTPEHFANFAVIPIAILLALAATELKRQEIWVVGWLSPKDFASVVHGILILDAGFAHLARLVGLAVTASIRIFRQRIFHWTV